MQWCLELIKLKPGEGLVHFGIGKISKDLHMWETTAGNFINRLLATLEYMDNMLQSGEITTENQATNFINSMSKSFQVSEQEMLALDYTRIFLHILPEIGGFCFEGKHIPHVEALYQLITSEEMFLTKIHQNLSTFHLQCLSNNMLLNGGMDDYDREWDIVIAKYLQKYGNNPAHVTRQNIIKLIETPMKQITPQYDEAKHTLNLQKPTHQEKTNPNPTTAPTSPKL